MNIIIIGATSGIGYGLLKKYAVPGNTIGILGRRRTILKELEERYPSNVLTSSLKKHAFYNLLINNILCLCVT